MTGEPSVDPVALREEVKSKYREVALEPNGEYLWTAGIAGGLPCEGWLAMLRDIGFEKISVGTPYDTFGDAGGEEKARLFEVNGFTFMGRKPE